VKKINPVKLFISLIIGEHAPLEDVEKQLVKKISKFDYGSEIMQFDKTDYYYKEMGQNLRRKFISFNNLIMPDKLADIKRITCDIEKKFSLDGKRTINIDPGYIEQAKVILASTKNFYHRIYIGKGIYAEVTLHWQNGGFNKIFEWTYPDYQSDEYRNILNNIRGIYLNQ